MEHWDVVIVGAGPAGSACAWALRDSGFRVLLLDRARFPRNKVCGGWITPSVVSMLQLELHEYARTRVLQPISGFRIGYAEQPATEIAYDSVVSYGILRCEFDEYLLRRSGTPVREGYVVESLEQAPSRWIINNEISASLLVGAGGHFCPIARLFRKNRPEDVIVAQEVEFEMSPSEQAQCKVSAEVPELYFCADLKGYGWCVRKANYLNLGLGRLDKERLSKHVHEFIALIQQAGRIGFDIAHRLNGHAYITYTGFDQGAIPDGVLLIGDALGTAAPASGEGIGPAILSGLFAAQAIVEAQGDYGRSRLAGFSDSVKQNLSSPWSFSNLVPAPLRQKLAAKLLQTEWFCRKVVLDDWFLQRDRALPEFAVENSAATAA
jgi:flavin-dependent dehydrogenase